METSEKQCFLSPQALKKLRLCLAECIKNSTFAPLFGVTDDRKKSCLVMLRWNNNNLIYQIKWI